MYNVWISLIKNLGVKKYTKLMKVFGTKEKLWRANKEEICKIDGIEEKLADDISNEKTKRDVKRHLKFMEENNINIISLDDDDYPKILKQIYNPPLNLYIRGNKEALKINSIGIVGCRKPTNYGINIARKFSYYIAKSNFNIVSGLAMGIDSYAHIGAVLAKEKTTAVLGNGLDIIYPKENLKLSQKILDFGGAVISEYPLGTKPEKNNFPARNRIISGLSKGILIVEAKENSGSMITLDFALEQNRDVFAIPGNITSLNSFGTNEIIKQGAKLVTSWEEVIEDYI